ncbi:MAG TPA: hypothetical protein VH817_22985 [Thermoleophilaceae bacterium]|jgi:hypothetical protein
MYPGNAHVTRIATDKDVRALIELANLDSQRPLGGEILIGEIDGAPAAAISLSDGRVVSDPFKHTALLTQSLRMRAAALRAVAETPSLRQRILNGVSHWRPLTHAA